MDRMSPDRTLVGLQRWTLGDAVVWILDYKVPWGETVYSEVFEGPGHNPSDALVSTVIDRSREMIEGAGDSTISAPPDTVLVAGARWAMHFVSSTPTEAGLVELWEGEVVTR